MFVHLLFFFSFFYFFFSFSNIFDCSYMVYRRHWHLNICSTKNQSLFTLVLFSIFPFNVEKTAEKKNFFSYKDEPLSTYVRTHTVFFVINVVLKPLIWLRNEWIYTNIFCPCHTQIYSIWYRSDGGGFICICKHILLY